MNYSQSSLQDYVECARRYQLRYLERLKYPAVEAEPIAEREQHMRLGERFHHLVYQHLVGIAAERLEKSIEDEKLRVWWQRYLHHGIADLPAQRLPEITLFAPLAGQRLIAKYDLIAVEPGGRAVIVDWKTSEKRPKREILLNRLQTLIYRYVLVEAGAHLNGGTSIAPEAVEMVYWFSEHPNQPERIDYDAAQHQQVGEYLAGLIREIEARTVFEKTEDTHKCLFCTYRSLCERGVRAGDVDYEDEPESVADFDFDFDQIAEIEF